MQEVIWRPGARVLGVKNSCRKVAWHSTDKGYLGEFTEKPDEATVKTLATEWIDTHFKKVEKAQATLTLWQIEDEMETWQPFNENHNLRYNLEIHKD